MTTDNVWEQFVGSQPPAEFLRLLDDEIEKGKYADRWAGFVGYANFALTNLCVPPERQVLYNDGWDVSGLATALQQYAEGM